MLVRGEFLVYKSVDLGALKTYLSDCVLICKESIEKQGDKSAI